MCRCILSCTSPSWWSFTHHSLWLLSSPSFPSARSCSPVYLPLFLSHSVLSKSIFYTVKLIAEVRKMPFGNLSPDVLLVGQRIFGCSSGQPRQTTRQTILRDAWQTTTSMKTFWRRWWKTSSDRLFSGKRDFKDLGRVHHKIRIYTPAFPNSSWQLAVITGELQHRNERPRWELFNLLLSGKICKPPHYSLR